VTTVDLFVIGGGINGAAIARDAAGRGLRVALAERGDYGGATSSASSKLIHGGLRYLEQGEFRLVRESLRERRTLLAIAPHLVHPLRFVLPLAAWQKRPGWMFSLGLFLYDRLAGPARIEETGRIRKRDWGDYAELDLGAIRALLHYPDCQVDDSRLVLETLLDARCRGAEIRSRAEVVALHPREHGYSVEIREGGLQRQIEARIVVNAAGPWADGLLGRVTGAAPRKHRLRLVRGSHIVIRRPPESRGEAFTLPAPDGRVVFVLPWLDRYRLIGTTDIVHEGGPDTVSCSEAERDYLLAAVNAYFRRPLGPADIVWSYAGVRPLLDDGSDNPSRMTRDYAFELTRSGQGGLLTVFGGKLTTHRILAERALDELRPLLPRLPSPWTASAPLHGGGLSREGLQELQNENADLLTPEIRRRWCFTYGSVARDLFEAIRRRPQGARCLVRGLPEIELQHAATVEDARTAEDFLCRRTKLFLDVTPEQRRVIERWFSGGGSGFYRRGR
jgi:glycerol-3-phosphate dehydrogenase